MRTRISRIPIVGFGLALLPVAALANSAVVPAAVTTAATMPAPATAHSAAPGSPTTVYASLPLTFERNEGQTAPEVKFLSRGSGRTVFFTEREIVFSLSKPASVKATRAARRSERPQVIRMRFAGANTKPEIAADDRLPGQSNYFIGNDPSKWRRNVTNYGRVRYHSFYPGIDATFYGSQTGIEYDLVVSPGADPRKIRLSFDGVERLDIDADGNLILRTKTGNLLQRKPVVYQEAAGGRREISGSYVRRGRREVSFQLAAYDRSKPIVLDPVLSWSTYLGGGQDDFIFPIAVDGAGNVYLTGGTQSTDFPTHNPIYGANAGGYDVFIAKVDAAGTGLIYSTYVGDTGDEWGQGIAVDTTGNVYVTGETDSNNFPTTPGVFQAAQAGFDFNAFVTKISSAGDTLLYSTYLGGSGYNEGDGIAVDSTGNAYVAGWTGSSTFPTMNPIQPNYGGGTDDAFVAKINATGTALIYSTYLGGSDDDVGLGIAIDGSRNAFVTGGTVSTDFPTQNPIQAANAGGRDGFVTEINAAGTALVYSTYLGGSANDSSRSIAVDGGGNAYILGTTFSSDFPTKNPLQAALGGGNDKFVAKLDPAGSHLVYSTYLGGSADEGGGNVLLTPQTLAVDGAGDVYLAFATSSTDLPTVNAIQSVNAGGRDGYVAILNSAGNTLLFATYIGGSADDGAWSVGFDAVGRPYITGNTNSTDFLTQNPIQPANAGNGDIFVAKIAGPFVFSMTPTSGSASGGTDVTITGVDFQVGAVVTIGGLPAAPNGVPTSTQIGAITPVLSSGTLNDVTVTNPDTNAATLFKGWFADFGDVPPGGFHDFIEKIFRNGITAGCGGGDYCAGNSVTRAQMAVFVLKGKHGSTYVPPACTGVFPDVACPSLFADWIEELFHEGITGGCGGGDYCPTNPVTRAQMAVFLLKAEHGSTYVPPPCTGIFPDVPCPSLFADWIEQLFHEGITGGCGGGNYCPSNPVTRGQMAVFLVKTFGLQ